MYATSVRKRLSIHLRKKRKTTWKKHKCSIKYDSLKCAVLQNVSIRGRQMCKNSLYNNFTTEFTFITENRATAKPFIWRRV